MIARELLSPPPPGSRPPVSCAVVPAHCSRGREQPRSSQRWRPLVQRQRLDSRPNLRFSTTAPTASTPGGERRPMTYADLQSPSYNPLSHS